MQIYKKILPRILRPSVPPHFAQALIRTLLFRGTLEDRNTAQANYLAIIGQTEVAGLKLAQVIQRNPHCTHAIISLSFLIAHRKIENIEYLFSILTPVLEGIKIKSNSVNLFFLKTEILFRIDPQKAREIVKSEYFTFFMREQLIKKRNEAPMLYWHIPKTGGTSFCSRIAQEYYRSGMAYLPSYTSAKTLAYIISAQEEIFPFLSSAHLSANDIGLEKGSIYREFVISRDPKSRALSAWRQYRANPFQRLRILPQHGSLWQFLPICDLREWCKRAPRHVINPFEYTFISEDRLSRVDNIFKLDELNSKAKDIFNIVGLQSRDDEIRSVKNMTDKSIVPHHGHLANLEISCKPDTEFLQSF